MKYILSIQKLIVLIDGKQILHEINLTVSAGSVHAFMGPNGSGKSTLAYTIMGHPCCNVQQGSILFNGYDITDLPVEKRARLGLFLVFQHPYEIPGLTIFTFLKEAYTAFTGNVINVADFNTMLKEYLNILELDESFIQRGLNEGFSGGEKKRLEMLQLLLLNPTLAIIDEIDSGLDVDALRIIAKALHICKERNPQFTMLLVTHYQRILDYIKPDVVHILEHGTIVQSGDYQLAQQVDLRGYRETFL